MAFSEVRRVTFAFDMQPVASSSALQGTESKRSTKVILDGGALVKTSIKTRGAEDRNRGNQFI
jgi:hypothetical protein